ncbi:MAG: UDP binding domain-containing protein, partial [Actinomycetota bacterium]
CPRPRPGIPGGITLAPTPLDACRGADVLAILTEWDQFKWVDPAEVARTMTGRRVVDARNLLDRSVWKRAGFSYEGIGR